VKKNEASKSSDKKGGKSEKKKAKA